MLAHSYQVKIRELQAKIKGFELDLLKNPSNERAEKKLKNARDELQWFTTRVEEGRDPGVRIL